MNTLTYLLALNRMPLIGPITIGKLLKRWPNIQDLFQHSTENLLQAGLPKNLAETIKNFDLSTVNEDIKWLEASPDHHILSRDSKEYPALLKEIHDAPILLYAKGNLSAFNQTTLAMVGSRNPSVTGSENAKNFAREIAAFGVTIVSGLALGIDGQAHLGCLEAGGQTVAVLGTGIDCIYPRRHLQLAQHITEKGLLISEFPLQSQPIAKHFPRRNRIISGLSSCTLVVEAAIKSGSLITAQMALDQNRDVLAIPGSIHNPMARGCHYLLQQGAKLVTSASDVLEELKIDHTPSPAPTDKKNKISYKSMMLQYIGNETTSIDQIISRSGMDLEKVLGELAMLELNGAISAVPGGYTKQ